MGKLELFYNTSDGLELPLNEIKTQNVYID